jgi:hypothetical protein
MFSVNKKAAAKLKTVAAAIYLKHPVSFIKMNRNSFILVPRKGLEPPRSYSLVPETSASTNSATWAFQERKALYQKY